MSDMVERVARALFAHDNWGAASGFPALLEPARDYWMASARVAIAAMRGDDVPVFEDISNMDKEWKQSALPADVLNAGECACWDNGGRPFGYNGVTNIWRAMIDAALKGDKP